MYAHALEGKHKPRPLFSERLNKAEISYLRRALINWAVDWLASSREAEPSPEPLVKVESEYLHEFPHADKHMQVM